MEYISKWKIPFSFTENHKHEIRNPKNKVPFLPIVIETNEIINGLIHSCE